MDSSGPVPDGPVIGVIDDDSGVREALVALLGAWGFRAVSFASAEAFLAAGYDASLRCLVVDVQMSGMGGRALQERLASEGWRVPMIFLTAHADAQSRERALLAGAVAYLDKPCDGASLLKYIRAALAGGLAAPSDGPSYQGIGERTERMG